MHGIRFLLAALVISAQLLRKITLIPVRHIIARDPHRWVIIGSSYGEFTDNSKHYFCWLQEHAPPGYRIAFLAGNPSIIRSLNEQGVLCISYRSFHARLELLYAGTVIVDGWGSIRCQLYDWFKGARLVQLWHGVGLKEIELQRHQRRIARLGPVKGYLAAIQASAANRFPIFDYFFSTSTFYTDAVFRKSFRAKRFIEAGYPRNDCLYPQSTPKSWLYALNVDDDARKQIRKHRKAGGKVILYAPTFRDDLRSPFGPGGIDLHKWIRDAHNANILLLLKLHVLMKNQVAIAHDRLVRVIDPASDIYPLLPDVDLLVTDYSSIASDFLLLNRPIIFFPYDMAQYSSESRAPMFDYNEMTPGPKALSFDDLVFLIHSHLQLLEDGSWVQERERVCRLAFDYRDGISSQRIWNTLTSKVDRNIAASSTNVF